MKTAFTTFQTSHISLPLVALGILFSVVGSSAADYKDEQEVDRLAGLLGRPWDINKIRLHTRSELPSGLQFGLPPYKQQPEGAQVIPIVAPVIQKPVRVVVKKTSGSTPVTVAPAVVVPPVVAGPGIKD